MNRLKRIIFIIFVFFITVLLIWFFTLTQRETKTITLDAPKLTNVKNYIKFTAQPISINSKNIISIKLSIETFQKPDFLEINILKICFLEDELENPISPISFKLLSKTDYKKEGLLKFKLHKNQNKIILKIFELEERSFKWFLKDIKNQLKPASS